MAFEGTEQQEFSRDYFTGKSNVKVVGINLTAKEKQEKLGYTKDEEPNYNSERDGVSSARIEFNLETKDGVKFTQSFFVEDKHVVSKDETKTQMVNEYGQTAYLPNDGSIPENMSWYSTAGLRKAYKGEEQLLQFLTTWRDVRKGQKFYFSNFAAMFKGDFSEVRSITSNNSIGLFFGVKQTFGDDGKAKYSQVIYPKLFVKQYTKAEDAPNPKGGVYKGWINQFTEAIEATRNAGGSLNINYGETPYSFTKVADPSKLSWLTGDNTATSNTPQVAAF